MARRDLERLVKGAAHSLVARAIGPRPGASPPAHPRRILVTKQHNQLGDFILATPLIASLARAYPDASVDYLASPLQAEAAGLVPEIRRVWLLEGHGIQHRGGRVLPLLRSLRARDYDLAISVVTVSYSTTSALLLALAGARYRIAGRIAKSPRGRSLFHAETPIPEGRHETDRALSHLAPLGIAPGVRTPRLSVPEDEVRTARLVLAAGGWREEEIAIGLHPGAGKLPNRWPAPRFGELARRLLERPGTRILLFAGPGEEPLLDAMNVPPGPRVLRMTRLTLRSLASFLRCLTLYVGNDTGTLHLAAALGVPTVGLFGPTDPAIWAPRSPRGVVLRGEGEQTAALSVAQVESAVVERLAALYSESS